MNQETDPIQNFTVFVGGLNFQTDESSLKSFFSATPHISGINNVRICRRIEGTSKGFGYVTFNNKFSYIQSLSLNGYLLDGKSIRVEADHSKKLTISTKKESKKSNNLYASSTPSAPVKKKKSKSHSELSESSSDYSSYSYSSSHSYSAYSSDSEKRNQNNRRKNKKRKHRDYSDYSYSS